MDRFAEYRSHFPALKECVYLDTAYDCGGTDFGIEALHQYFADWTKAAVHNERGGPGRKTHFEVLDQTRELIAELLGGVSAEQIAFTRNTNEGLNALLQGFAFEEGDNILVAAVEHPSVLMPALNAAKLRGVECRVLGAKEDEALPLSLYKEAADEHTRMILCSHVQSSHGCRIDLEGLGAFCKERGIFLLVDAIQSLGILPFQAKEWNVSAVTAAGYKTLTAVNAVAFLYAEEELLKRVWPVYTAAGPYMGVKQEGETYSLFCKDDGKARKLENSSLDNPGIYCLREGLLRLKAFRSEEIADHVEGLWQQCYQGLRELDVRVVTPEDHHAGILAFDLGDNEEAFAFFRSRNIALSLSGGRYLRVSFAAFSDEDDVNKFLEAVKEYRKH